MSLEYEIARAEHDLAVANVAKTIGIRTADAAILQANTRLNALYTERDKAIAEEMRLYRWARRRFLPKRAPQTILNPLGPDEYLAGDWVYDEGNRSRRPNR